MGFPLVPKPLTLNDLEQCNDRRRALSLLWLSFLFLNFNPPPHQTARCIFVAVKFIVKTRILHVRQDINDALTRILYSDVTSPREQ